MEGTPNRNVFVAQADKLLASYPVDLNGQDEPAGAGALQRARCKVTDGILQVDRLDPACYGENPSLLRRDDYRLTLWEEHASGDSSATYYPPIAVLCSFQSVLSRGKDGTQTVQEVRSTLGDASTNSRVFAAFMQAA